MTVPRKDYIPRPDGGFAAFENAYYTRVSTWWAAHGLPSADLNPLKVAHLAWQAAYPAHVAAQAAAESSRVSKDTARAKLMREIRPITRRVQAHPATTDADRALIGITVRGEPPPSPPVPTTRPLVRVDAGGRLSHTVRFSDESTPSRTAKPHGVLGAEVWLALTPPSGAAPPLGAAYRFLSLSSRGSARRAFQAAEAGKTAHYALRWVSTRGEKGPWSEIASATVAA